VQDQSNVEQAPEAAAVLSRPADFVPDATLTTDLRGLVLEADDAAVTLLHCSRSFLIGKPLGLFVCESQRPAFYERLMCAWTSSESEFFETRLGPPRREPRDVLALRIAVTNAEGRITAWRWLLRDVSDVRRVERALSAERQLLDAIVDAADAIILLVDGEGRVLRSNSYTHRLSG
jgi:PAS domain-containing protein